MRIQCWSVFLLHQRDRTHRIRSYKPESKPTILLGVMKSSTENVRLCVCVWIQASGSSMILCSPIFNLNEDDYFDHAPYMSVSALTDYLLFPGMKENLTGKRFGDVDDVKRNVTAALAASKRTNFKDVFNNVWKSALVLIVRTMKEIEVIF